MNLISKIVESLIIVTILVSMVWASILALSELSAPKHAYLERKTDTWSKHDHRRFFDTSGSRGTNEELAKKIDIYFKKYVKMAIDKHTHGNFNPEVSHSLNTPNELAYAVRVSFGSDHRIIIGFNHRLMETRSDRAIEEVVAHEVAHAIGFYNRDAPDHGPAWRNYCKLLMPTAGCNKSI